MYTEHRETHAKVPYHWYYDAKVNCSSFKQRYLILTRWEHSALLVTTKSWIFCTTLVRLDSDFTEQQNSWQSNASRKQWLLIKKGFYKFEIRELVLSPYRQQKVLLYYNWNSSHRLQVKTKDYLKIPSNIFHQYIWVTLGRISQDDMVWAPEAGIK